MNEAQKENLLILKDFEPTVTIERIVQLFDENVDEKDIAESSVKQLCIAFALMVSELSENVGYTRGVFYATYESLVAEKNK